MTIMASADIRLKYNDVVDKCRESGEPIFLTKNGQGELVVMDIASFEKREQELRAQQLVLEAFAARLAKERDYSLEESKNLINNLIEGKQQWIVIVLLLLQRLNLIYRNVLVLFLIFLKKRLSVLLNQFITPSNHYLLFQKGTLSLICQNPSLLSLESISWTKGMLFYILLKIAKWLSIELSTQEGNSITLFDFLETKKLF